MFCFIEVMNNVNGSVNTVSAVSTVNPTNNTNTVKTANTVIYSDNNHMKNPEFNVGVIVPPDEHYKPVLYSDAKATNSFVRLNRDIYQGVKNSEDIREKKTPLSIKILLGVAALAAAIFGISKLIRR